jgi:hypothetical protein
MDVANMFGSVIGAPIKAFPSRIRQTVWPSGICVVIYGLHSQDWMTALAPEAGIWKKISGVKRVLVVPDSPAAEIPAPTREVPRVVVIPLMEPHTRNRPKAFPSLAPDERALDAFGDKIEFQAYVRDNGLEDLCPAHFPGPEEARFPCILKRKDLNGGIGVAVAASAEHLQSLLEQPPWRGHPFVLQAKLEGCEFVTHCVCKKGRILWHTSFAYGLPPGESIRTASNVQSICPILATDGTMRQLQRFLTPLNYSGPCNFDYKFAPDGTVAIMEINPRLGGSLMRPENRHHLQAALSCIVRNARRS